MKKWYQENYVSRRDWILENISRLNLSPLEALVLLEVDFNNGTRTANTMELLATQLNVDASDIDDAISSLCRQGYLEIVTRNRRVVFDISGVFEDHAQIDLTRDLFDTFESEFGRTLSQKETVQLAEMQKEYDKNLVLKALREAVIQNKFSMNYIERILSNWKNNE